MESAASVQSVITDYTEGTDSTEQLGAIHLRYRMESAACVYSVITDSREKRM